MLQPASVSQQRIVAICFVGGQSNGRCAAAYVHKHAGESGASRRGKTAQGWSAGLRFGKVRKGGAQAAIRRDGRQATRPIALILFLFLVFCFFVKVRLLG